MNKDTLSEIAVAINEGIEIDDSYKGFKNRNGKVVQSDYLIAFTFSTTSAPNDGGTLDTWQKSTALKIHITIPS